MDEDGGLRIIGKNEVAKHNGKDGKYWIIIQGYVHDVTDFLEEHPGGEEILESLAGGDGTECFQDVGHSLDAINLCKKYRIGKLGEVPGPIHHHFNKSLPSSRVHSVDGTQAVWCQWDLVSRHHRNLTIKIWDRGW